MEVKNDMQNRPSKKRLLIVTGISLLLSGCSISDWYNGYYAERAAIKKGHKARDDYYNAESPQMKELRSKNQEYCLEQAHKPENRVARAGYTNGVANQPLFQLCMKNRGTPTFEAATSIGKCVGSRLGSCYSQSVYNGADYVEPYLVNSNGVIVIDKNNHVPIPNPEFEIIEQIIGRPQLI